MNGFDITLEQSAFLVEDKIFKISDGFNNFLNNQNIPYEDIGD